MNARKPVTCALVAVAAALAGCIPIIVTCVPTYPPGVTQVVIIQRPYCENRTVRVSDPAGVAAILGAIPMTPSCTSPCGPTEYIVMLQDASGRTLNTLYVSNCESHYATGACFISPPEFTEFLGSRFYTSCIPVPVPDARRYDTPYSPY